MKRCSYCGATYPDDVLQCPLDHTPLTTEQPGATQPQPLTPAQPQLGLAIASLILGILSATLSFLLIGFLLGVIGIALAAVHLAKRRTPKTMATWGLGLSIFGILASLGFGAIYYAGYVQMQKTITSMGDRERDITKWEGVKAPDLSMTTLDGKTLHLTDFKGKRVVLDFWATWCPPCRQEIPHFIKLNNQTSRDKLIIIGISDESPAKLKKFTHDNSIPYPIANATDLPAPYKSLAAIPTTFYIDTKGIIQKIDVGYHDYSDIKSQALADDYPDQPKPAPSAQTNQLTTPQPTNLD